MCACAKLASVVSKSLQTYGLYVAHQAPLSMGFSRQEHWSRLPCSPPGDLPNPWIKPSSLMYPELAGRFFSTSTTWEASYSLYIKILCLSIYPYIDIWLHSTFWLSNAAMKMDVQIPLWDPDFNFLWVFIKLAMKLLNHMVILFNFLRNCHFTCSYIFILIDTCSFFIKAILMIVKW